MLPYSLLTAWFTAEDHGQVLARRSLYRGPHAFYVFVQACFVGVVFLGVNKVERLNE